MPQTHESQRKTKKLSQIKESKKKQAVMEGNGKICTNIEVCANINFLINVPWLHGILTLAKIS
jgi:hypothetical protein